MNEIKRVLDRIDSQKHICRLDFFEQSIFLTKYEDDKKIQYEVSAEDIQQMFSKVKFSTGILPTDVIYYARQSNLETVVILKKGVKREIYINGKSIKIPFPDHIFCGKGFDYRIFAVDVNKRFFYQMPLPNIHPNGKICQGTATFTKCSPKTIHQNYETFWASGFNEDLSQGRIKRKNLISALYTLQKKTKFPKKWLIETNISLENLMEE